MRQREIDRDRGFGIIGGKPTEEAKGEDETNADEWIIDEKKMHYGKTQL